MEVFGLGGRGERQGGKKWRRNSWEEVAIGEMGIDGGKVIGKMFERERVNDCIGVMED